MIQKERIHELNVQPLRKGRFVLDWMEASQRAEWNHALEHAAGEANRLGIPLVVLFGIAGRHSGAKARHFAFMLEGLRETEAALARRKIRLVVLQKAPDKAALSLAGDAALIVTDVGYLRSQRTWRRTVAQRAPCLVVAVESDVVVPVEAASDKEEYAAATFRPKLSRRLEEFLIPLRPVRLLKSSLPLKLTGLDLSNPEDLSGLPGQKRIALAAPFLRGGTAHAKKLLDAFIAKSLPRYDSDRNDPGRESLSHMSPYLHFGQISPLAVALSVDGAEEAGLPARRAYLEELIVRRELSVNFVHYNPDYDRFDALPTWARETLAFHEDDRRDYVYNRADWEKARTHDPYWNAAQTEMVLTGKMHGYMRMYWGKKILEWSATPEEAFDTALTLNNRYELDGRGPNAFAGVAWCFGKHDRPWGERAVYGKVRSMVASGLRRKFDIEAYVDRVDALRRGERIKSKNPDERGL